MLPSHDSRGCMLPHTARDFLNQRAEENGAFEEIAWLMKRQAELVVGISRWQRAINASEDRDPGEALDLLLEAHGLPH